nr:unnamed protein product [Spirometra erinaceieuropaei]
MLRDLVASDPEWSVINLRYFNPVGAHPSGLIGEDAGSAPKNIFPCITKTAMGLMKEVHVFGNDYDTRDGTDSRQLLMEPPSPSDLQGGARLQQHNASIGELQFVDSGNIPVYLKRCSSLDCAVNHSSHQNPSVHSFAAINRPLVQASPTLCVEDDPEMIFSNTQSRSPPLMNGQTLPPASSSCQWPPLSLIGSLKRPLKSPHWSDYGNSVPLYERHSRTLQREETPGGAMELSLHAGTADQLPTISPEVYSCRNAYQYLTTPEFNNHLIACPSDSVGASTLNNRLSMRRESSRRRLTLMGRTAGYEVLSQSLGEHPCSPAEPCTELTKNDFRDTCGVDSRARDGTNTAMSTATISSGIFGREQVSNVGMPFEPPSQFADATLQNSN